MGDNDRAKKASQSKARHRGNDSSKEKKGREEADLSCVKVDASSKECKTHHRPPGYHTQSIFGA